MQINVYTNADFYALETNLRKALQESGDDDINVSFAPGGVYFFYNNHLKLDYLNYPGKRITINGNGATIIGAGTILKPACRLSRKYKTGSYDWGYGVIDLDKMVDVRPIGPVKRALAPIEVIDENSGLCRFKADEKNFKSPEEVSVQFTSWYLGLTYPVVKIEGGYIYFTAHDLTYDGHYYNIEGDKRYKNALPKYQILNSPQADAFWYKGKLRFRNRGRKYNICEASKFLFINNCTFKSFEVKGLNFLGNSDLEEVLIHICRCTGGISFHHCTFRGIRNRVFSAFPVKSITISDNTVEGCYRGFYRENIEGIGTTIVRNVFRGNQLFFGNFSEITCLGQNFRIADNIFEDFSYGAVSVGVHFASSMAVPPLTSGVVENNEMYQTDKFRKEPTRTLMDSGAIYCTTSNLDVILRNNYIHDYTGGGDNRGIFLDDGTNNVTVERNRVERIANSYCIDMRRVASVETMPNSYVKKTNVGDKLIDNIVDGTVRWEPNSDDK